MTISKLGLHIIKYFKLGLASQRCHSVWWEEFFIHFHSFVADTLVVVFTTLFLPINDEKTFKMTHRLSISFMKSNKKDSFLNN
jgi:hypothetical protein